MLLDNRLPVLHRVTVCQVRTLSERLEKGATCRHRQVMITLLLRWRACLLQALARSSLLLLEQ